MSKLWSLVRAARRLPIKPPRNPHYDPAVPHHLPRGFRNRAPDLRVTEQELALAKAASERARAVLQPGRALLQQAVPDWDLLASREVTAATWIGHSTVLMQMRGRNILTDPMFSNRASPLPFAGPRRRQPPGLALHELPHIDVVVVSHSHWDHCDVASLRALARQAGGPPQFAVPLGLRDWFRRRIGRQCPVTALDWWQEAELAGVRVTFCPAHHWSARTPWDRNATLWGSWALERQGCRFFFSGDLAYADDIREIGERLGPFDLAAIAIGHYEPRRVMKNHHLNPDEAVRAHLDLRARRSLAIHWGVFNSLTLEPLDQPVLDLADARQQHGVRESEFFALALGASAVIK